MRLPVVEFGRLLGLRKPIIIGDLYGRLSVPDKVLDDARLLRLNQSSAFRALTWRFESQPMDRIIDGWMALLGLQTAGRAKVPLDAKLAELLRVRRVTVWRWRRQVIRPNFATLMPSIAWSGSTLPASKRARGFDVSVGSASSSVGSRGKRLLIVVLSLMLHGQNRHRIQLRLEPV